MAAALRTIIVVIVLGIAGGVGIAAYIGSDVAVSATMEAPGQRDAGAPSPRLAQATPSPQPPSTLPGGASSLNETYRDWQVACAQQGSAKRCIMRQQQFSQQNRQRVLAIEIGSVANNRLDGVLVLPFGLALDAGVKLQIDDGVTGQPLRFKTCLPAGCVVPLAFDAPLTANLRKGAALKVTATADGGEASPFSISLNGFATALDRIIALSR